jgi:hypothetical protein
LKLDTNTTEVLTSGGSSSNSFSIAMNGKAFKVLSDTLYQNKIGSIVRELSCNAYDAHVAVSKQDTPFLIHLPDNFEPWFSVQDYGIGLSPEAVKTVFTVYFESTKDNSNDSIGAFGLGAKTPFSYTDQFTVTSVFDGIKSIYGMFITASGVPDYKLMASSETNEPNGVEIKLGIKNQDFSKVRSEVITQLKYFKVKPNVINGQVIWPGNDYAFDTEDFSLNKRAVYGTDSIILQGNVGYPLDNAAMSDALSTADAHQLKNLSTYGLVLKFNIGDIGVTASREGVEYTPTTVENIRKKFEAVMNYLKPHVESEIKAASTEWEAVKKINSHSILKVLAPSNMFKMAVRSSSFVFRTDKLPRDSKGQLKYEIKEFRVGTRSKPWDVYTGSHTVNPETTPYILIHDAPKRSVIRMDLVRSKSQHGSIIPIIYFDKDKHKFDEMLKDIKATYGDCPIKLLSEVEIPTSSAIPESRKGYKVPRYYGYNGYYDPSNWDKCTDEISDIKDEYVYILIDRLAIVNSYDVSALNAFRNLSLKPKLIGVRLSQKDKIPSGVLSISEYIQKRKKELNTVENRKELSKYRYKHVFSHVNSMFAEILKDTNTEIGTFYGKILEGSQKGPSSVLIKDAEALGMMGDFQLKEGKFVNKVSEIEGKLLSKYPLLKKLRGVTMEDREAVASYVETLYNKHLTNATAINI